MIETRQKTYKKPKSEGCHCSDPKPDGSCCNLICFERPNYFCGHLLTDTDLSKEQQYVIEKHKLYNRALHGWGVVCGLRLTCGDPECCGSIVIDEGYAIDDCGNDLVVCEPLRFDVVSLLKEKGWIVGDPVYDPCLPEDDQEDCEYTQCFYVTVCYDEEPSDFTTPFVAGCRRCSPSVSQHASARACGLTCSINCLKNTVGWRILLKGSKPAFLSLRLVRSREHLTIRIREGSWKEYVTIRTTSKEASSTTLTLCFASCVDSYFSTCKSIQTTTTANCQTKSD